MSTPDPNATDNLITQPFGSGASNPTYITLPIPVPSQILSVPNQASFTDAFPPSTMTAEASGGLPFFGQDMNGILYMITANIAALAAGRLPQYSATRSSAISGYPLGALVAMANGLGYWLSIADANVTDPETGGAGWRAVSSTGEVVVPLSSGTVTLTAIEAAYPLIGFDGTLTGNVTVNFPANAGQAWVVAAYTAGAFTITLQTAAAGNTVALVSGSGYSNAQNVFSNGTDLWSNNVSTAGLAPIASPGLTGTPTAPTAPTASNSTQIGTTAFVKAAIAAALATYAPLASPPLSGVPTAPTPATSDNSAKLATTAFVQALFAGLFPDQKSGTFTAANGVVSVSFGHTFASPPRVFVQWNYAGPDVGWIVPGSITTTGFQYQTGNAGTCDWLATLA